MPTEKQRIERLQEILTILSDNGGTLTFGKLYGKMALKYGTTKRTFDSYLEALKLAEKIDYKEIVLIGKENENPIILLK